MTIHDSLACLTTHTKNESVNNWISHFQISIIQWIEIGTLKLSLSQIQYSHAIILNITTLSSSLYPQSYIANLTIHNPCEHMPSVPHDTTLAKGINKYAILPSPSKHLQQIVSECRYLTPLRHTYWMEQKLKFMLSFSIFSCWAK